MSPISSHEVVPSCDVLDLFWVGGPWLKKKFHLPGERLGKGKVGKERSPQAVILARGISYIIGPGFTHPIDRHRHSASLPQVHAGAPQ